MKQKVVWLILSCLVVVGLILTSCGTTETSTQEPATTGEETETSGTEAITTPEETAEETDMVQDIFGKMVEKPQYGGTITRVEINDNLGFDEAYTANWFMLHDDLVYEEPLTGDWTKGPLGTNETIWSCSPLQYETGALAESWEFPDAKTIVLHIRQGVHWQDKAPVNGREMVAEDIAYAITHHCQSPTSYPSISYPGWFVSATVTDGWTVEIKGSEEHPLSVAQMWDKLIDSIKIFPPEVIEEYGDLKDWENAVGTGPFMLVDYVPNSMQYFEKSSNYWGTDPLLPDYSLPYADSVRIVIIPDNSTRVAALRTCSIDILGSISWDDRESLRKTNADLEEAEFLSAGAPTIYMRTDTPPLDDINVRKALVMAIDRQEIAEKYYGGPAEVLARLVPPQMTTVYTPLEELPEDIRRTYEYHPDEAEQLLADAGYPDGFKVEVVTLADDVDMLSLVKNYWSKIGVDLDIQTKDYAAFTSLTWTAKEYKHMVMFEDPLGFPYKLLSLQPNFPHNRSIVNDSYINEKYNVIWAFENMEKPEVRDAALKDCVLQDLSQVYVVQLPTPYLYTMWQPWLKGYGGGVAGVGYCNGGNWVMYAWVDQELKESMGY